MINPGCLCVCPRLGPPTDRVPRAGARQLGDGGSLAEVGGGVERREPVLRGSICGRTLLREAVAIRDAGVRVCVRACVRIDVCVCACARAHCAFECVRERVCARVYLRVRVGVYCVCVRVCSPLR